MITARGLAQTFHTKVGRERTEVRAVDGVDLDVAEGEVVGFLGPNGAGKTTTLRTISGVLRVRRGHAGKAGTAQHRLRLAGRRSVQRGTRR